MTTPSNFKTMVTGDGLTIRYGLWSGHRTTPRGTVLVLSGRGEFIEKYFETIQELNRRGFSVATFDWRGQGLSDRMLPDRRKGHVGTYDDYLGDLKQFVEEVVYPMAGPGFTVLAHSMGAHVALRFCHDYPGRIKKAVLTSPLIDIAESPWLKIPVRILTGWAMACGLGDRIAAGRNRKFQAAGNGFARNRFTRDPDRYRRTLQWLQEYPDLGVDGVTFGWLQATFKSLSVLAGEGYAEAIQTPLLVVTAGADQVVSVAAQQAICARLPHAQLEIIPESRHEILIETDAVRRLFWQAFDRFTAADFVV